MNMKNYDALEHAKVLLKNMGNCGVLMGSCKSCGVVTSNIKHCNPSLAYLAAKTFVEKNDKLKSIW